MATTYLDQANRSMLRIAEGQAVYAPTIITHPSFKTLVALQMFGPELAVKANWAALMNNTRAAYRIHGNLIVMEGSKEHITIKKMLPCGWLEMWLIHKQAAFTQLTPADSRFYLLEAQPHAATQTAVSPAPPPQFFLYLNKILATPMLPSWAMYLWQRGIAYGHIVTIPPAERTGPYIPYTILTREQVWQGHIKHGLHTGQLSLTA